MLAAMSRSRGSILGRMACNHRSLSAVSVPTLAASCWARDVRITCDGGAPTRGYRSVAGSALLHSQMRSSGDCACNALAKARSCSPLASRSCSSIVRLKCCSIAAASPPAIVWVGTAPGRVGVEGGAPFCPPKLPGESKTDRAADDVAGRDGLVCGGSVAAFARLAAAADAAEVAAAASAREAPMEAWVSVTRLARRCSTAASGVRLERT
mmetsp:Transcript_13468/g.40865  ORF Transcript_13468/g.40865 Transcript_13468/m.40865 type:complete len:210 (+) Transcript_13468:788-1417(+)